MTGDLDLALLVGAAVLLVAVAAVRLSTRLGLPSLVVYLLIGMLLGESGLGIRFDDADLTLRRLRLPSRRVATLEAESGMNDAPVVLLVVLLSVSALAAHPWWQELLTVVYELAAGAAIGVLVGLVGRWLLRHAALPSSGLYPIAAVGLTVLAYAAGAVAHASGFLAVYAAGVILGNARLPHRRAILGFADGLAWVAQIGLFVLLGLLVSPAQLPGALVPALVVGAALVLVARPLSVVISVVAARPVRGPRRPGTRIGWPGSAFLSWAGLRGAVPIVLATIPLSAGTPGAPGLFDAVFVLVIIFTLVQASTLAPAARLLRVAAPGEAIEIHVETAPLERLHADLLQIDVVPGSRLAGVHIDELRLPVGASVTLVVRGGAGFVPGPDTRLKTGDELLIVATAAVRDLAERRMRAISRRGRLARWFGEEGGEYPAGGR
jgi:cell volume regulation protein A